MKKKAPCNYRGLLKFGGSGEIRTHGGLTPSSVFKTGALNRSATLPFGATKTQYDKSALSFCVGAYLPKKLY